MTLIAPRVSAGTATRIAKSTLSPAASEPVEAQFSRNRAADGRFCAVSGAPCTICMYVGQGVSAIAAPVGFVRRTV